MSRASAKPSNARALPAQAELALPGAKLEPQDVLEGEVVRVTYQDEASGFRVLRVQVPGRALPDTVVGTLPAAAPGTRVRATGRYVEDAKHGRQFRAQTLLPLAPATLQGVERYLASGMVRGIGRAFARRIVATFGEDTLRVLDQHPEKLGEVPGLGQRRVAAVVQAWKEHRDIGAIMVFLQAHGASPALATRIYKHFGAEAINVVSRAPFRLALEVWGIGFLTADAIARQVGVAADSPDRIQAGLMHCLHEHAGRGHVYAERERLAERAAEMLGCQAEPIAPALEALAAAGRVRSEGLDGNAYAVYLSSLWGAEQRVAERLGALLGTGAPLGRAEHAVAQFERLSRLSLAPAQRDAVGQAARSKVLVITGGPGVGKTTIVKAILALFDTARIEVLLCAPTGRAAKRLSEATGREAKTIHRLLELQPKAGRFARCRARPLEAGAVIVDEASMVDLELADALLQAVPDDARLVLVGDVDQLPSVGPGAVLRDVIASGRVPTVLLTQIFRQAEGSSIVENAHRIHDGLAPVGAKHKSEQFYVVERRDPEAAAELIRELVTRRIPEGFGLDPLRDIQVLTPMQRGVAGAVALNAMLQQALNPAGAEVRRGERVLRVGDKVMQLRNDYDKDVFNGDIGRICAVDPAQRRIGVRFDEREVDYGESELDELTLAYAISIHKSQGTEYPAVVVPLLTQHFVMLARNLLYTAVTRGKRLVVLVADPRALRIALGEVRREERRTRLAEILRRSGAA